MKEGHLPAILKALAEEPRILPCTWHSILSANSSVVAMKQGHLPSLLKFGGLDLVALNRRAALAVDFVD